MRFGALGDIHGDVASVRRIMARHAEVRFWVCVGDVADADGRYEPFETPLYWIKGNNENFDRIASGALPANVYHLPNGRVLEIHSLRIAGLGGTYAPTWYDTPARELPYPGMTGAGEQRRSGPTVSRRRSTGAVRDDKRRHFVREEVETSKTLRDVDVFLSHEAPRPFRVGRMDAGKTPVNEVLSGMRPKLHLFGHHHRFSEQSISGVRSVGLDLVSRSYLLIAGESLEYDVISTSSEDRR